MNRKALKQLERVVRDAPDKLFVMNTFEAEFSCGTVRCAAGWAAQDAWFKENLPIEGFDPFKLADDFRLCSRDAINLFGGDLSGDPWIKPQKPRYEVTKLEVIANIRRLLAGRPTKPYKATGL